MLDTIQDFLCQLDMKAHMQLLEISIFFHYIIRRTKISNNLLKDYKVLTFKVIFQY